MVELQATLISTCSVCDVPLGAKGDCLACLLRGGLDQIKTNGSLDSLCFGDFEIARRVDGSLWELGSGAMGVTYRAVDKVLHRNVALKVVEIPTVAGKSKAVRERFLREARAAAALKHPNVAGIFQFGASLENDRCYYAMELVEGETLEQLVRREGPLPLELALEIGMQVTRALIGAAGQGLIHRDLKPGNIMLAHSDSAAAEMEVKVIDFGLAKIANALGETELTHGGFVGTPSFASPEQFSSRPADSRSDIYSLGVTLWYALTGEVPYPGKTIDEIRDRQQHTDLPLAQLIERKIPDPLIEVLQCTLALDPARRPRSAKELLGELEACRVAVTSPKGAGSPRSRRKLALFSGALIIAAAILSALPMLRPKAIVLANARVAEKSIAVLPFENLDKDEADAFFAAGVQDEILSDLAKIADLKVISRTSVMKYKSGTERNLREIGRELGVAHVLEGSVQRVGDRLRVNAQLIDARTDTHLWGETYDRDSSDVFIIQSEIADQIARQLQAKISPQEKAAIAERPTSDLTAYAFYTQAKTLENAETNYEKRVKLLREAIRLDPNFILAYCLLAKLQTDHYANGNFSSEADRIATGAQSKENIDTALRLRPDRGEPHLALAYNYFLLRNFSDVRPELNVALRLLPNDAQAMFLAARLDRHENRWEDALIKAHRAAALDPQSDFIVRWTSETYLLMRRYHDGEEFVRQARLKNASRAELFDGCLARFKLAEGDLANARVLSANQVKWSEGLETRFNAAFYSHDYGTALEIVATAQPDLMESAFYGKSPNTMAEAEVYRAQGNRAKAEEVFRFLRRELDEGTNPESTNEWYYQNAATLDARLGRKEEAIREARHAVDILPAAQDPITGPTMALTLARVYAWTGERDLAIEQLAILAGMPSNVSYGNLRFDPDWDSLRRDPRFDAIVANLKPESAP